VRCASCKAVARKLALPWVQHSNPMTGWLSVANGRVPQRILKRRCACTLTFSKSSACPGPSLEKNSSALIRLAGDSSSRPGSSCAYKETATTTVTTKYCRWGTATSLQHLESFGTVCCQPCYMPSTCCYYCCMVWSICAYTAAGFELLQLLYNETNCQLDMWVGGLSAYVTCPAAPHLVLLHQPGLVWCAGC